MTVDATEAFFGRLAERGHEPLLEKVDGSMRFDVVEGRKTRRWLVSVHNGDISVSPGAGSADCVLRTDKALFDRVAAGRANAMAAYLRGAIAIEGDVELLVLFQRLLPSASRGRRRRRDGKEER
jgi:predicted lipid carrier protein YhbT